MADDTEFLGPPLILTFGRGRLAKRKSSSAWAVDYISILGAPSTRSDFVRWWMNVSHASALVHPNLLMTFHMRHGRMLEATSSYTAGMPLDKVLATMRLSTRAAVRIVLDIVSGLMALHDTTDPTGNPLAHGDIRPANIIVGSDGRSRLFGYGLRGLFALPLLPSQAADYAGYQSPDTSARHSPSTTSDIFSLGVVLWEAVAGQPLFMSSSPSETEQRVMTREPARLTEVCVDVPEELADVCAQMLAKRLDMRTQSAAELYSLLGALGLKYDLIASPTEVAMEVLHTDSASQRRGPVVASTSRDFEDTASLTPVSPPSPTKRPTTLLKLSLLLLTFAAAAALLLAKLGARS